MRKQVGLKLEVSLVARVDAARGDLSRTAFFERALEAALAGSPGTVRVPASLDDLAPEHRVRVEELNRAVRRLDPRVQSSADAKAGVVPRWRGTGTDGSA